MILSLNIFMTMTPSVSWAKYEFEIISKKKGFFQEFSVGECEKEFILFLPLGNVVKVWIIPKKKMPDFQVFFGCK